MKKFIFTSLTAILLVGMTIGCASSTPGKTLIVPSVSSVTPHNSSLNVPTNGYITVQFSEPMNPATITVNSFTVVGSTGEKGSVVLNPAGTTAIFTPSERFSSNTFYTATITTEATNLKGTPIVTNFVWNFATGTAKISSPDPIDIGTAENYVILAKSAVSLTGKTAITGHIGLSPAAQSFMTGFSEKFDRTNIFALSPLVTGNLYAADMKVPTPSNLTLAINDMESAYSTTYYRENPNFVNLAAGNISNLTLVPGLYNWNTGVKIDSDITIKESELDVWIFQISGDLTVSKGVIITLSGGALAKNIFWQVDGETTLKTSSEFAGILLCRTQIAMEAGAKVNGRLLAQTAVTLDSNTVTKPVL